MTISDEKFFRIWLLQKQQGKRRFVLVRGVLLWGLPCGVSSLALRSFPDHTLPNVISVLIALLVWSLGGVWFGGYLWNKCEKRFEKLVIESGGKTSIMA
jgi:undecaprenyl pyrophosphate phosphatase UppP